MKKKEMTTAFVLMNTEIGSEEEVVTELRKLESIKEAYVVYGVYDIVARVEAETTNRLREIVSRKLRGLDNVRSTITVLVVD